MLVRQRIGSPLAFILVAVSTAPLASNTCSFRGVFALHTFTNFASPESIALDFTMSRLASAIVGVAKITIEVAGVPGAAVATSLLELIIKEYDEVKGHEVRQLECVVFDISYLTSGLSNSVEHSSSYVNRYWKTFEDTIWMVRIMND